MEKNKPLVVACIHAFNEEGAIGRVIEELKEEGYGNILVVDGYSEDRTVELARLSPIGVSIWIDRCVLSSKVVRFKLV